MEIAKAILRKKLDSTYLKEQTDSLTRACEALVSIGRGGHLTAFQQVVFNQSYLVLYGMAREHRKAISDVVESERIARISHEETKSLIEIKLSGLTKAGRMEFVVFNAPHLLKEYDLSTASDEEYLLKADNFQKSVSNLVCRSILDAKGRNVALEIGVETMWGIFEENRKSIARKLAARIRAYERILARTA